MLEVYVMTLFAMLCPIDGPGECKPWASTLVRQEAEWTNHECKQWANSLVDTAAKEEGLQFVPEKCNFTVGIFIK